MKISKKLYPFIPVVGFFLVLNSKVNETGIDNSLVFVASVWIQTIGVVGMVAVPFCLL